MASAKDVDRRTTLLQGDAGLDSTGEQPLAPRARPGKVPEQLRPGDRACDGRFEILGRLGQGGMGVVYAARDRTLGTQVALKTLTHMGAGEIYRLKNEFRALADVAHPNLVTLHELFRDQGRWLFSMALVRGETFQEWVRPDGVLDESRLRLALPQLADAIAAIHRAGHLHRDLKPSNVLVTPAGRVVVLDMGLAIPREPGGIGRTIDHAELIGTPGYMAPEQISQDAASTRSDWYAFGVMLFEALTSTVPFEGRISAVLTAKQAEDAPPVHDRNPGAPSDLAELADALLARTPEARPDENAVRAVVGSPAGPQPLASVRPLPTQGQPMLGREAEQAALFTAFDHSLAGALSLVFVDGPSGIGKSTLLSATAAELEDQQHAAVLRGRCYEREAVPFKAFDTLVDALSRYLRRLPEAEAAALLPRDVRPLARMFPALDRVSAVAQAPDRHGAPTGDAADDRRRAFAALAELLGRIRDRRPLIIMIDDMQWCDSDSARFLSALLARQELPPVLLVLSSRSEGADAPALSQIQQAAREARVSCTSLAIGPLPREASKALALSLLHAEPELADTSAAQILRTTQAALAERITREADGSPLFVGELARYINTRTDEDDESLGNVTLARALGTRMAQLSPPARRLLNAVSLAVQPLPLAVASRAAELGPEDGSAVEELRAGLFVKRSGGDQATDLEVYHDRIRETVTTELAAAAQLDTHARLASAMLDQPDADPERLAYHLAASGERQAAATHTLIAARQAMRVLAFERAVELLRRIHRLAALPPASAHEAALMLADALGNAGRGPEAAEAYLEASRLIPERGTELRLLAARQLTATGYMTEGLGLVERLLADFGLRPAEAPNAFFSRPDRARLWLQVRGFRVQARPLTAIPTDAILRMELLSLCQGGFIMVDQSRAAGYALDTLKDALRHGHAPRAARMIGILGSLAANSGDTSYGQELIARAERMLHEKVIATGLYPEEEVEATRIEIEQEAGITAVFASDFGAARERLDRALAMHRGSQQRRHFMITACESFRAWALFLQGDFASLRDEIGPLAVAAEGRADVFSAVTLSGGPGVVAHLAGDRVDEARRHLAWAASHWPGVDYDLQHCYLLMAETLVEFYAGNPLSAFHRLERESRRFRASPVVQLSELMRAYGLFLHGLATASALAGAQQADRSRLREALARDAKELGRARLPWAEPHVLMLQAAALRAEAHAGGKPQPLGDVLQAAWQHYLVLGLEGYAEAAKLRLGEALGGERGKQLRAQALDALSAKGAVDPARLADMLLPLPNPQ